MIVPITEVMAWRDDHEFFRKELPPGEFVIGRESECDLQVDSGKVSRQHARLTLRYSDWVIEDLGSSNGTFVGEARIEQPTLVFPRQDVRLGNVRLRLTRVENAPDLEASLAPQTAAVLRFLPAELRDGRRYRVKRMIAMGGMGAVLEVEDAALRRTVAMKVLLDVDSPERIARFVEEAQVTSQLAHPNIVPIYDMNVNERDNPFFTMKLLDGRTLRAVLDAMRSGDETATSLHPLEELVLILRQACDAVAFAHSKGVVHRDLKPDNVMLGEFGEVLVMDWGLAKPLGTDANAAGAGDAERTLVSSARREAGTEFATGEHEVMGTPHFMAPEQAEGGADAVDARTDVYALGAILYEMLTLKPPVDGADVNEVVRNVCEGRIRPPIEAVAALPAHWLDGACPAALSAVAMKALSREKKDRHQSAGEFHAEVRRAFTADRRAAYGTTPPSPAPIVKARR